MAVQKVPQISAISLRLQKGINAAGHPVYVTRHYPCKVSASDQDMMDVATGLAGLQSHRLATVERVDTADLINA